MCFISKDTKIYTATKSILVCKILESFNSFESKFYRFRYKKGATYRLSFKEKVFSAFGIFIFRRLYLWYNKYVGLGYYSINKGFHSYVLKDDMYDLCESEFTSYIYFIIPKGSRYYVNNVEYVSDSIRCVGKKSDLDSLQIRR